MSSNGHRDNAIEVRGLSKIYRLAHNATKNATFRDVLMERLRNPFKRPTYEDFWALRDVSFDVPQGEVVGVIGRNGAGKSTLLKILSRVVEPTAGVIDLYGRVGSLLEVGTGFHPELTGRENIYLNGSMLGMRRKEITRQFDAIVDFAEVEKFLDTPVKRYSSGMYVRLAFAVAAHLDPEILIVDEVLAVGDIEFQKKCLGKMNEVARSGRTVLFVSHNMSAVESLCTSAMMMRQGEIIARGDVSSIVASYLGEARHNTVTFDDKPLRSVSIFQEGKALQIEARWAHERPLVMPTLGFVISDSKGMPICGGNPVVDGVQPLETPRREGLIRIRITQPQLLDGTYRLSVWFGDGKEDFVAERDCIAFDVAGMSASKQLSVAIVGPVYPICRWELVEDESAAADEDPDEELARVAG
jgi:lipopolysaccharide transport system ATP-binding protein